MTAVIDDDRFGTIARALRENGWCAYANFLDATTSRGLAEETNRHSDAEELQPARIGAGRTLQANNNIRGDYIRWLDETQLSPAQRAYRDQLELLRSAINEQLFLGLFDLELHLTRYPAGARYRKHLDRHAGTADRLVSCILYLNADWQDDDGGALRLYLAGDDENNYVDIAPRAGTLVTFLSGDFPHEVLPARRPRLSVTGWFRRRAA